MPARQPGPVPGCRAGLMRLSAVGAFAPRWRWPSFAASPPSHQCLSAVGAFAPRLLHRHSEVVVRSPMPFGCGRFRASISGSNTPRSPFRHQCLSAVGAFAPDYFTFREKKGMILSPMPFGCGRFRASMSHTITIECGGTSHQCLSAVGAFAPRPCEAGHHAGSGRHQCLSAVGAFAPKQ